MHGFIKLITFLSVLISPAVLADTKFLACSIERMQSSGMVNMDTTDFANKFDEPLIKIENKSFSMLVGNMHNEELFPDFIQVDNIGSPKEVGDNVYMWDHFYYSRTSGYEVPLKSTYSLTRDSLKLTKTATQDMSALGLSPNRQVYTYGCRLTAEDAFKKLEAELSARYRKLFQQEVEKEEERKNNRKI